MNGRERLLTFFNNEPIDRLPLMPITMMFAADQIEVNYKKYALDHNVLVQAQIATALKFDLDYVSVISDPAREVADLGGEIAIYEDQPPSINEKKALLADKSNLHRLTIPDLSTGRMHDRIQAVRAFRSKVGREKLIEGWIEGPCAESADLRGINTLMLDFYDDPDFVQELIEFVLQLELKFAEAQIEAGADLIGVGDAAASLVGPKIYRKFIFPAEMRMIHALHEMGTRVRLHICGKTRKIYQELGELGCEIIDLDFMNPMDEARQVMGELQILLGNLAPVEVVRNGTATEVYQAVEKCHQQAGKRFIVGAGCEIPRGTPDENLFAMTRYAQEHSP
ncbi:MAG: uroporphyrinogen decarboxylase family protein [bacterium]|jgi:MtaA/CmuA family methyltransferase